MNGWKDWFLSRSIISSVVAGASLLMGVLFGYKIDEATQALIIDQWIALATGVGTFWGLIGAIYYRIVATKQIGTAPRAPPTQ